MHREKHFYFKMLITFEPNVAQRSVASQNDHKSKACLPEASNTAFTMYRRLKRHLRRLYEAPFFGASTTLIGTLPHQNSKILAPSPPPVSDTAIIGLKKQKIQVLAFTYLYFFQMAHSISSKKDFELFWIICASRFVPSDKLCLRHNGQHTNIITTYRYQYK